MAGCASVGGPRGALLIIMLSAALLGSIGVLTSMRAALRDEEQPLIVHTAPSRPLGAQRGGADAALLHDPEDGAREAISETEEGAETDAVESHVAGAAPGAAGTPFPFAKPAKPLTPDGSALPVWAGRQATMAEARAAFIAGRKMLRAAAPAAPAAAAPSERCRTHTRTGAAQKAGPAEYTSVSEAVRGHFDSTTDVVVFTQGNTGFHPLLRNFLAQVSGLRPSLPVLVVALDAQERDTLMRKRVAYPLPVVFDPAASFDERAAGYREDAYNRMTMHKWKVAMEILQLGKHAFMIDPDIAMLRNPLPYMETLPECDYSTMMEGDSMDGRADEVIAKGGFAQKTNNVVYDNLMNTGFTLFRATPRMQAVLREFFEYLQAELETPSGKKLEDQTHWANFLRTRFQLAGLPGEAPARARGQAVVDAILAGRCIDYVRVDEAEGPTALTFHPLNPHLFLNRPGFARRRLHTKVLERPFAIHYNYLVGTAAKVEAMRNNGHYVEEQEDVVDEVAEGGRANEETSGGIPDL